MSIKVIDLDCDREYSTSTANIINLDAKRIRVNAPHTSKGYYYRTIEGSAKKKTANAQQTRAKVATKLKNQPPAKLKMGNPVAGAIGTAASVAGSVGMMVAASYIASHLLQKYPPERVKEMLSKQVDKVQGKEEPEYWRGRRVN